MRHSIRLAITAAAVLLAGGGAEAQQDTCTGPASETRLYVDVERVRSSEGLIAVTLYEDKASRFLAKRGSLYVGRVPATAPVTTVCIYVPTPGIYAIAVYHDADSDRSFDRTGIGLPDEAYGFSNNPAVLFGLPAFRSVRLSVPRSDMHTRVRLRYP